MDILQFLDICSYRSLLTDQSLSFWIDMSLRTVTFKENTKLSLLNGKIHSYNDFPALSSDDFKVWYFFGEEHRENGKPSSILKRDKLLCWKEHGEFHRENGRPAYVKNSNFVWFIRGKRTKTFSNPAIILNVDWFNDSRTDWSNIPDCRFDIQRRKLIVPENIRNMRYKSMTDILLSSLNRYISTGSSIEIAAKIATLPYMDKIYWLRKIQKHCSELVKLEIFGYLKNDSFHLQKLISQIEKE